VITRAARAVVADAMAVSALVNASRNPDRRRPIADEPILVSFVTITVFVDLAGYTSGTHPSRKQPTQLQTVEAPVLLRFRRHRSNW
jgi:hypothetical protein